MFTPWEGHWREYVRRWTVVDDFENWAAADRLGGGTMVCGGHISNWEMMAAAGGMRGIKLTMTTRHLKPKWLHRWMEKARLSTGIRCVYQPRTMPTVMKVLRAKEAIGFVVDQYMVPPMGQPMKFFGATVDTLGAIAPLARRTGALITPVRGRRTPDGIVHAQFEPAVAMTGDDGEVNQRLNDTVENWIREYPAEWLWVHRRFKNAVWPADRKTQPV
jgi:KDO2-lipid IV(A) lauroyltransferase